MPLKDPIKRADYFREWKRKNWLRHSILRRQYYLRTYVKKGRRTVSLEHKKKKKFAKDKRYRLKYAYSLRLKKARYYQLNKSIIHQKWLQKLRTNINCKIAHCLRNSINRAIKYRAGSAVRDLGCSIVEFIKYIESKFLPGMTWGNHSSKGWHLDHIVPLCKFNLVNRIEFLKATHFTNYQPLWAKENLSKNRYAGPKR
jgi:hypothetical protein